MFQLAEKRKRVYFLIIIFIVILLILIYRLFQIQVVGGRKLTELAKREHILSYVLEGQRGLILDRNLKKLAVNVDSKSLFAIPYKITNSEETARILSKKVDLQ